MQIYTNKKDERGISLLIVLLVGTVMLVTSLAISEYATRLVLSLRAKSDGTAALYHAEQAFECVKYWLNRDFRNFGPAGDVLTARGETDGVAKTTVICNGVTYDFTSNGPGGGVNETQYFIDPDDGTTGVGEFTMYSVAGDTSRGVKVHVRRDNPALRLFDGSVRVHSRTGPPTGAKTGERYQEYDYMLLHGADIMFVLDRSGSIDDSGDGDADETNNRVDANRSISNDWNDMLDAVVRSIDQLNSHVPAPDMGILSFGTDVSDTGQPVGAACPNCYQPDVPLTSTYVDLVQPRAGIATPVFTSTARTATNLSLGISIAGAELMNRYYPNDGSFEQMVINAIPQSNTDEEVDGSQFAFTALPIQAPRSDRDDNSYPDVLVIVTDGEPNGIMTHQASALGVYGDASVVLDSFSNQEFIGPLARAYAVGDAKIFRTGEAASGRIIVDDLGLIALDQLPIPAPGISNRYRFCYDGGPTPDSYAGFPGSAFHNATFTPCPQDSNTPPNYAMCNGTIIANELKEAGITIIAVYVGTTANAATDPAAHWLEQHIVSWSEDDAGNPIAPLFAAIDNYRVLDETILYLFEQMNLVESR